MNESHGDKNEPNDSYSYSFKWVVCLLMDTLVHNSQEVSRFDLSLISLKDIFSIFMNTRLFSTLLAVHRYGSMAEAARRMNLTHGAVAQQIRVLEQELGVELVHRAGRAVHLTNAGHRILAQAQKIIEDVDALAALAHADEIKGELQLAAGSTVLTHKMADILVVLNAQYPDIRINLVSGISSEFYEMVENNSLDAAIAIEPNFALSKSLGWKYLTEEPFFLLASVKHLGRDPMELLQQETFIRYHRGSWVRNRIDTYLKNIGVAPRGNYELASTEAIVALVHRNLGIGIVPSSWHLWRQGPDVVTMPLEPVCPPRRLGLVWARSSPRLQLIEAFWRAANQVYHNAKMPGLT